MNYRTGLSQNLKQMTTLHGGRGTTNRAASKVPGATGLMLITPNGETPRRIGKPERRRDDLRTV